MQVDLLQQLTGLISEIFAYIATRAHNIKVKDILAGTLKMNLIGQ